MASLLHSSSDEVLDLEPGRSFGERFEIVRELDRDEWSRRYFAVDKQLGARALVRVASAASDSAAVMLEAAERMASLRHAKVLPILGSGCHRDVVYVAHSHVSGERLEERILTRPLPLREFVPIASQLLMPVSQAHQHGVGVGPVRPQDVLLRVRDGHASVVELSDFGMGVVFGPLGGSALPLDDVPRLGRLFAQMLTAELPSDLDPGAWWATRRLADDIPVGLRTMIENALAGDGHFTDAQALVERMIDVLPPALFKLPVADGDATTSGRRRAESSGKMQATESPASSRNRSNGRMRPVVATVPDSAQFQPAVQGAHAPRVTPPETTRASWVWFGAVFLVAGMGIGSWIWWKTNAAAAATDVPPVEAVTRPEPVAAVAIEPTERLRPVAAELEPEPAELAADDSRAAEVIELGRLIIAAASGAEILIDDESMGGTPYLDDLPVGRHEVRIVRGGVELWSKTVDIEAGQTHRFVVNLAAASSSSSPRRPPRDRPASRNDQAPDNSDEASGERTEPGVEAEPRTPPAEPPRSGPFLQPSRRGNGSDPFLPPSE